MDMASKSIITSLLVASATAAAQPGATNPSNGDEVPVTLAPVTPTPMVARHHAPAEPMWGGGVRLTGLSGVGALPGVNLGAEVAGFVRRDERFLELAIGRWVPQDKIVVAGGPTGIDLKLDVWTLRGGWASTTMPLRAWLLVESGELAGQHANQVTGAIARMVGAVDHDKRWLAAGGGFGVAWPMSDQARLVGTVELAIPVERTPIMVMTGSPFEPDVAAARANLGIEVGWR